MTFRQFWGVLAATAALVALVLVNVDWSPAAVTDPARTLFLNAQGVLRWSQNPDRTPFSVLELVLFLAVGLAFVAAGITAWHSRPNRNPGLLLVVSGWMWLAAGLRLSSHPLAFTLGVTLTLMYQPPLLQLALCFPGGVLRSKRERRFVTFFFASWLFIAIAGWAFFDPRQQIPGDASSSQNLFLLWNSPEITNRIGNTARVFQICVGLAVVAVLVARWRSGTPAYRAAFLPLWLAVILKTAATIWVSLAVVQLSGTLSPAALLWQYPATAVVPFAVLFGLWRYRFARGTLGEVMVEIGAAPVSDKLVRVLRRSVHDPTLALWLWSAEAEQFVDDDGRPQALPNDTSGRAAIVLERSGTPFGALVFDETLKDQPELLAALSSATALTLENQHMEQQLRDQLIEVRRSRQRIVTAGDDRRRQLERDLHDGAQQRLVAVAMALARARRAQDPNDMRFLVEQAGQDLNEAVAELRELAHGVYPPSLRERGLLASVTALAERAALPIQVKADFPLRPPPTVELAAYFICAEAVTNAVKHAAATSIAISLTSTTKELFMTITDNGRGGAEFGPDGGLLGLTDRAEALGGVLTVTSPPGRGTTISAVLPFVTDAERPLP
jgi:signal transduction histidine kinase